MHAFSYMRNARMGIDETERPTRQTIRRVLSFARPYRSQLIAFVTVIVVESVLALVPTLVFRALIDNTIPDKNTQQLAMLAGIVIAVGVSAVLSRPAIAPIVALTRATEHIEATGDLDRRIDSPGRDEVGRLQPRADAARVVGDGGATVRGGEKAGEAERFGLA